MKYETLTSIDNPILETFRLQKDSLLRQRGEVLLDSAKIVERFLKTSLKLKVLVAHESFLEQNAELIEKQGDAKIFLAAKDIMESIVGFRIHSGVIALGERPADTPLEELDDHIVFLNGVNNSENIGAIARNALAFGAQSIIADPQSCTPFVRRSIRVSMGAVLKCKLHHSSNGLASIETLKGLGYKIFGATLSQKSIDLHKTKFPKKSVLVIGQEGDGIHQDIEAELDQGVHIAMEDGIDSLNAAVASGIFLHKMKGE